MRYSLVSRFRGTLLGGVIGENLAQSQGNKYGESYLNFGQSIIPGVESLISLGKLDIDEWLGRYQKEFVTSPVDLGNKINIIFATIAIALFFHENPVKLRQNLLRVLKVGDDDPVIRDCTLAIGYAIAQSLTEKLRPQTLIQQIISFIGETETLLPQKLLIIDKLLEQRAGLEKLQTQLSKEEKLSSAVAMAFYCFLSTLEDFRLSVLRGLSLESLHSPTVTVITGVLSGSYNSTVGIPTNWQISLLSTNSAVDKQSNLRQVLKLADALGAVWSGVYNLPLDFSAVSEPGFIMANQSLPVSIYAAPRVIRGG